jgi:hypothetical protein
MTNFEMKFLLLKITINFRLLANWNFEICENPAFRSTILQELHSIKSFGPIPPEQFSKRKLENFDKNFQKAFLIRQCSTEYDIYFIDAREQIKEDQFKYGFFKCELREDKWICTEIINSSSSEHTQAFPTLLKMVQHFTTNLKYKQIIPSSEDKSLSLQLSASENALMEPLNLMVEIIESKNLICISSSFRRDDGITWFKGLLKDQNGSKKVSVLKLKSYTDSVCFQQYSKFTF